MTYQQYNRGIAYAILGGILLCLGLSKFIVHLMLVVVGIFLLNAGLRMLGKPPIFLLIAQWISELRW